MYFRSLSSICFITLLLACNQVSRNKKNEVSAETDLEPGYYGQWLFIKSGGTNVLPDMRKYNWEASSVKRASSNALINVYEFGPFNVGGRIRGMVVDQRDPNRLIVGGASGGIFISTDKGGSWKPVNDQQLSPSVTGMDQNPLSPDVLYFCSGEFDGNSADLIGAGIFKSTDGGQTFSQLPSTNNANFQYNWAVKCSPVDTNTLFVGTNGSGLWRSTDAGTTFTKVYNTAQQVNDVELLPDGSVLITIKGSGVFRSASGNVGSFTKVASISSSGTARGELAFCKKYPNVVYAAISGVDNGYSGVLNAFYKSSDGGQTFAVQANPDPTVNFGFTWYAMCMAVNETDSNSIVIGATSMGYSTDGGKTWLKAREQHSDHHIMVSNGTRVYAGCDGGLSSYNWGSFNTYTSLNNGLNITQFYAGAASPHVAYVMGGCQDNGTNESRNSAPNFTQVGGGDGGYAFYHASENGTRYVSTQNGVVYKNNNRINDQDFQAETKWFIHPYHVSDYNGDLLVYPSYRNLYVSWTGGDDFSKVTFISTGTLFCATSSMHSNPSIFTGGSSAFVAIDSAANGTPIVKNLRPKMPAAIIASFLNCIKVIPGHRDQVYLAFSNISDSGRVYKVTDVFGTKPVYTNISGNLPKGLPVNWVECDPLHPDSVIFAGTDYGLYITEDAGNSWIKDTRIPSVPVMSIQVRKNQKDIYFFTHGRGVFKGQLSNNAYSSVAQVNRSGNAVLYPVPARYVLNLKLPSDQKGEYSIYDAHGKLELWGKIEDAVTSIPIHALVPGNYILNYRTREETGNLRFNVAL